MLHKLLNYNNIYQLWINKGSTEDAAIELTIQQLDALEEIVGDDNSWYELIDISARGRNYDAWLAADWPDGFDELLLCVPLCKFVNWECCKCTIGKRQENNSCAMDYSLFGYIGELVKNASRKELIDHISNVRKLLKNNNYIWNVHKCELDTVNNI